MALKTPTELASTMGFCYQGEPFVWVPAKASIVLKNMEFAYKGEPFVVNYEEAVLGHPYILRVQGIPGMRTFSQMGHGGL